MKEIAVCCQGAQNFPEMALQFCNSVSRIFHLQRDFHLMTFPDEATVEGTGNDNYWGPVEYLETKCVLCVNNITFNGH